MASLLNQAKTPEEAHEIIEKQLPGWIKHSMDRYCIDYPHLQANWEHICKMTSSMPQKIILVTELNFTEQPMTPDHSARLELGNYLTQRGYCVRRVGEMIPCVDCGRAIPCREIWIKLKEANFSVPDSWSDRCSSHTVYIS